MHRPLTPFATATVTHNDWSVSTTQTSGEGIDYKETTLSVRRSDFDEIVRHECDGYVFECPGDAEWFKHQIGVVHPFRPITEGL